MVVSPAVAASEQWQQNLASLAGDVEVRTVESITLASLSEIADELVATRTVVPDADRLALRIGLSGLWTGCGTLTMLLMRDPADERPTSLERRVVRLVKGMLLARTRRRRGVRVVGLRSGLVRPVPGELVALEPLERHATRDDVRTVRRTWQLDDDRCWFGVVGAVTARKNLPLVAEALDIMTRAAAPAVGLVVAGPCQAGVLEAAEPALRTLRARGVPVVVDDRVLGPVEFDAAVQAVDCLVVAHSNEGPSAVIARAGMHGIRVVASGARSLARDAELLAAAEWTELEPHAMAAAMRRACFAGPVDVRLDLGTRAFCEALLDVASERPDAEGTTPRARPNAPGRSPGLTERGLQPMKILVVSNLFLPDHAGGASIYSDLCVELAARGHEVTVRCSYPYFPEWTDKSGRNGLRVERTTVEGVRVERHGLYIPANPRSIVHRLVYEGSFLTSLLRGLWRGPRPDVVMAFSTMLSPVAFASTLSTIRRVPLQVNVQDFMSTGATAAELVSGRASKMLAATETRFFRSADELVTISPEMVETLESMTDGKVPVRYIPNWLNASQAAVIKDLPSKDVVPSEELDLLYAGNIGNKQNLLRFCEHLHESDLPVRLTVHGSGPGAAALADWWETHRDPRFDFLPFLDEDQFVRRLHASDAFLITERSGSGSAYMPSKLLPALATGTPVLAVCDDDSSLGREMARSDLGPSVRWDELDRLSTAVAQLRDASQYARWHASALTRSKDFDREVIIDDIEERLVALARAR